ncbi:hypothetical protein Tco_0268326 [Tanacetum coccineum]
MSAKGEKIVGKSPVFIGQTRGALEVKRNELDIPYIEFKLGQFTFTLTPSRLSQILKTPHALETFYTSEWSLTSLDNHPNSNYFGPKHDIVKKAITTPRTTQAQLLRDPNKLYIDDIHPDLKGWELFFKENFFCSIDKRNKVKACTAYMLYYLTIGRKFNFTSMIIYRMEEVIKSNAKEPPFQSLDDWLLTSEDLTKAQREKRRIYMLYGIDNLHHVKILDELEAKPLLFVMFETLAMTSSSKTNSPNFKRKTARMSVKYPNYVNLTSSSEEQPNERTPSPPPRKESLSPPQAPSKSISSKSTHYTSSSSPSESPTPTHVAPPPKLRFVILIKLEPQELPPLQVSPNDPYVQTMDNWPSGPFNPSPPPRVSRPPPGFPNPPPEFKPLPSTQPFFRDTKSHQVIRSRDITFVDLIYGARSVTDSSSLTKPIQKRQVVLVDIPKNLAENDIIVAKYGLSSEITQSLVEDQMKNTLKTEHPPRREAPRLIHQRVQGSSKWKKAIIEEMVLLEKNQTCSLVRISTRKKASQRLWMFKVKEEQNSSESKGFQLAGQEENLKCRLKEILYGLIQAARLRYLKFDSFMQKDKNLKVRSWAKLVQILLSEGTLSLLKILETKSLEEMYTKLVMKGKLKFCAA